MEMKRSHFVAAGAAALVPNALPGSVLAAMNPSPVHGAPGATSTEYLPFVKIAKRKGLKLTFASSTAKAHMMAASSANAYTGMDIDMARASIDNAIERAEQAKLTSIHSKLVRLKTTGTAAQQLEFAMGTDNPYYFPEDRAQLAGPGHEFHTAGVICRCVMRVFCWLSCWGTGDERQCREECHNICDKVCD
jgi:hypothetical protein